MQKDKPVEHLEPPYSIWEMVKKKKQKTIYKVNTWEQEHQQLKMAASYQHENQAAFIKWYHSCLNHVKSIN